MPKKCLNVLFLFRLRLTSAKFAMVFSTKTCVNWPGVKFFFSSLNTSLTYLMPMATSKLLADVCRATQGSLSLSRTKIILKLIWNGWGDFFFTLDEIISADASSIHWRANDCSSDSMYSLVIFSIAARIKALWVSAIFIRQCLKFSVFFCCCYSGDLLEYWTTFEIFLLRNWYVVFNTNSAFFLPSSTKDSATDSWTSTFLSLIDSSKPTTKSFQERT